MRILVLTVLSLAFDGGLIPWIGMVAHSSSSRFAGLGTNLTSQVSVTIPRWGDERCTFFWQYRQTPCCTSNKMGRYTSRLIRSGRAYGNGISGQKVRESWKKLPHELKLR